MTITIPARRDDHFRTFGSTERGNIEVYIKATLVGFYVWIADYDTGVKFPIGGLRTSDEAQKIFDCISAAL